MRRVVLLAVLVVAVGCGDDDNPCPDNGELIEIEYGGSTHRGCWLDGGFTCHGIQQEWDADGRLVDTHYCNYGEKCGLHSFIETRCVPFDPEQPTACVDSEVRCELYYMAYSARESCWYLSGARFYEMTFLMTGEYAAGLCGSGTQWFEDGSICVEWAPGDPDRPGLKHCPEPVAMPCPM